MVFCSNRAEKLSGNLLNIHKEFSQEKDIILKVQTFNFKRNLKGRFVYFFQSIQSIYELATADLFIIDDYFLPVYYIKNKHQRNKVAQVWHAIGHLKKYGLSIEKNKQSAIKHHSNYDFVIANAPGDISAIQESFDIESENIHVTGAPRLDDITNLSIEKTNNHGLTKFMYAPTYRDASNEDQVYLYINELIKKFVKKSNPDQEFLYLSLHPYLKEERINTQNAQNIEVFKDGNKSSDLLREIDALITDYSSILLDYSYFERPILIYAPDYEDYIKKTGFFVDYQSYVDTTFYNDAESAVEVLLNYSKINLDYVLKLKEDNFYYKDSKNSQRVYNKLNQMIK